MRVSHHPVKRYWDAVKRILKRLKYTRTESFTLDPKEGLDLMLLGKSEFARGESDRRSVTSAGVMYARTAISWFSRTQHCMISSAKAEYVAISIGVMKAVFIKQTLPFLVSDMRGRCVHLLRDSLGAINLANNPNTSSQSRHIDVCHHFST